MSVDHSLQVPDISGAAQPTMEPASQIQGPNVARKLTYILLAIIVCFGTGLRLIGIDRQGISGDEASSVWFSARGLRDSELIKVYPTVHWLAGNEQAPTQPFTQQFYAGKVKLHHVFKALLQEDGGNGLAYSLSLFAWMSIFGTNDVLVRMLSLLLGVGCIPLAYMCVRALGGDRRTGLVAALLTAVHPELIMFSQLARNYAMATFFSMLSSYFFMRMVAQKSSWRCALGFCLATTTALLSHYLTFYVFAAQLAVAALFLRRKDTWIKYVVSGASSLALLGVWFAIAGKKALAVLQAQNDRLVGLMQHHNPAYLWVKPLTWENAVDGWWQQLCFIVGALPYPCPQGMFTPIAAAAGALLFATSIVVFLFIEKRLKPHVSRLAAAGIGLLMLTLAAPAIATILSVKGHHALPFISRYAIFSVPYFILLSAGTVGVLLQPRTNTLIRCGTTALGSLLLIAMVSSQLSARKIFDTAFPPSPNPHFALAKVIQMHYHEGDVVVFPSWLDAAQTDAYLPPSPSVLQKVDTGLHQKVMLQRKNAKEQELFDLESNSFPSII